MDIEERAEKWAEGYSAEHPYVDVEGFGVKDLIAAYLAGSAQTQQDYSTCACPCANCSGCLG